ncbi:ROK family transcriptional regulator (plasmid) [Rhizobium sp. RCAM05350]|nr:ROK family transcriptional regulator [Rhizobium sp. RCAM05350]
MNNLVSIVSSPRRIRQNNEIAVLRALHRAGRLSRAELARMLNLNRSSSGNIIAELASAGLVREIVDDTQERPNHSRAGRPGVMVELVSDAVFFLGVEIGVEHITAARIDLAANIVNVSSEPFDGPSMNAEAAIERAVALSIESISPDQWHRCEGFGISTPAQMDRNGLVRLAPLLGWRDVNLVELAQARLPIRVPVTAENDANAFAIGATYGHSEAHPGVTLFIVLESGVGGGIAVDGNLFRGAHGLAGEIGHLHIAGEPGSGQNLEQLIGLENIMVEYRKISTRSVAEFGDFLDDVRDREPNAVMIAEDWARSLALALVQTCRIIDPDRVVLGGSVAALYPLVAARVAVHMQTAQEQSFPIPSIVLNDEFSAGSAFGAACMLHQRYLSVESNRFEETAKQE